MKRLFVLAFAVATRRSAIASSRVSSWAAAFRVQPTLAWMWER